VSAARHTIGPTGEPVVEPPKKLIVAHDVPIDVATQISHLPPVSSLFASLLGYNPMASLLPPDVLKALPPDQAAILTGKDFFPNLISGPFHDGLVIVFLVAAGMSIVAAIASGLRGGKYVHGDAPAPAKDLATD